MSKFTKNWYPGVFCGIGILILTLLPGSCFQRINPHPLPGLDKLVHVAMFGIFGFMSLWGYRELFAATPKPKRMRTVTVVFFSGIALGASTEILQQTFAQGRSGDIIDFFADTLGTFIGIWLFLIFQQKRNKNRKTNAG